MWVCRNYISTWRRFKKLLMLAFPGIGAGGIWSKIHVHVVIGAALFSGNSDTHRKSSK